MPKEEKLSGTELTLLIVIVLILLFFPCKMVNEHRQDVKAMSYYHHSI